MTKNLTKRRLAALSVPVLLAFSLTACGGDASGAPEDASKDEFCEALNAEPDFDDSLEDASAEDQAKAIKDELDKAADNFKDVGTPSDIPDDARRGFEISVDAADDLSEDDIKKAIEDEDLGIFEPDVSDDEQKDLDAFETWSSDYCGDSSDVPDLETPDLSDLPDTEDLQSDLEDLQSELPTDLPS